MPLLQPFNVRPESRSGNSSFLAPKEYDPDASSIRSDQDSDSEDDERQLRARNSRELRAHDRIVLMEEEEMDQLVIEARRRQDRTRRESSIRRGSNLALVNPLRLLSRAGSDGSRSRSPAADRSSAIESTEDLGGSRKQRSQRRREKKERLLEKAHEGEDGELMYEMEEGGLKEESSTGSSEREDSDEVDRRGLKHLADAKSKRKRNCGRWVCIYTLIAVAFGALVFVAWRLSVKSDILLKQQQLASNGTALFAPTTIIISLDGFRADFLRRGLTPRLNKFVQEGVSPFYMNPSFPSVTFPNHYTLATGLYPEAHGVVGNTFWDPALQEEFYYTNPSHSMQPNWWKGEPFWVTAEKQGVRSAIHMWPGSEAHISGVEPTIMDVYKGDEKLSNKVARIFEFLDRPGMEVPDTSPADMRAQLIAAYVPNVDSDGHKYGPNSTEILATIQNADKMLDDIFLGLEARNLTNIVNVIVVSDHGMATTDVERLIQMEDLVDLSKIEHIDGWPLVGLRPKNLDELQGLYDGIAEKAKMNPNFEVYLRDVNMPERYHFSQNDRIAPLWIIPKTGWAIVSKNEFDIEKGKANNLVYHPIGLHGYDHEHPLMRAIFIARGPAFPHQPGSRLENFQNIEVYNILCDSIGLDPAPNNGTLRLPLKPVGIHDDESAIETPPDPVTSYTITPIPTSTPSSAESTASTTSTESSSKVLGVDPVATVDVSNPVGVDYPDSAEPSESGKHSQSSLESAALGVWDWITDKVDKLWESINGDEGDGRGEVHA